METQSPLTMHHESINTPDTAGTRPKRNRPNLLSVTETKSLQTDSSMKEESGDEQAEKRTSNLDEESDYSNGI